MEEKKQKMDQGNESCSYLISLHEQIPSNQHLNTCFYVQLEHFSCQSVLETQCSRRICCFNTTWTGCAVIIRPLKKVENSSTGMRFVLASVLCNSLLGVKQTRQQMRAQGAINANYPRGPGRTRVHRWVLRWWGNRVKCIHSVAGLAAVKRLQQSGQVSISWPVTQWFHRVHKCCVRAATQLPELTIRDSNSTTDVVELLKCPLWGLRSCGCLWKEVLRSRFLLLISSQEMYQSSITQVPTQRVLCCWWWV